MFYVSENFSIIQFDVFHVFYLIVLMNIEYDTSCSSVNNNSMWCLGYVPSWLGYANLD